MLPPSLQQNFDVEGFYIICWLMGTRLADRHLPLKKPTYLNNKIHKIENNTVTTHKPEA
jgi:hypothetical protein